jgi:outer membrane lipoprotein-sorting protein
LSRVSVTLVTAALLCLAGVRADATQSIDQVIQKNIDAKGGLTRLKAIQTIKQTATLSMQGAEFAITMYSKRPNYVRQEMSVNGQLVVNGFDGLSPWILNPNVAPRAIVVTGPQAEQIRQQSNFDSQLMDYKALGLTAAMNGFEMMGGRRVVHVRLTSPDGHRSDVYLDGETYLDAKVSTQNNQLRLDQEMSDYRDQDGIKVPFLIRTLTNGVVQSELKVQKVEFNVKLDDALFKVPKG